MEEKKETMTPEAEQERIPNAVEAAQMARLGDEDLEDVAGGGGRKYDANDLFDRKGRWIGRNVPYWGGDFFDMHWIDRVEFYPCSRCGRPMHRGRLNFFYCDPCDRFEMAPFSEYYDGSKDGFFWRYCV